MSGKAGCSETIELHAGRGPDGMVKAELPEPQCPRCKWNAPDTMGDIRHSPDDRQRNLAGATHSGGVGPQCDGLKGTNGAPKPS